MEQFVGIDVAKATLEVALLPAGSTVRVANTAAGWAALIARLGSAPTGIVVEATSIYHVGVTLALAAAGMPAAVLNPQRTAAFKTWAARHAKTDRHDARALAAFAAPQRPAPTPVPSATIRALRELQRCRAGLTQTVIALKNRLETATALTRDVYARLLDQVLAERAAVDARIAAAIAADAELAGREALLRTVPGVGAVIAAGLVAGLPELGRLDAKALAALAGVAPHPRDSGATRGLRRCVGGRRHLARALYQMAVTAVRWDPAMRAHYQRLCSRRPRKVALVAVARRMLGIMHAMLRDGLTWRQTRVGQGGDVLAAA